MNFILTHIVVSGLIPKRDESSRDKRFFSDQAERDIICEAGI